MLKSIWENNGNATVLQLRLTPEQLEAKTALESAVEDVKQELVGESNNEKKDALTADLKEKEAKLDTLMAEFEVIFALVLCSQHHRPFTLACWLASCGESDLHLLRKDHLACKCTIGVHELDWCLEAKN